MIPRIGDKHSAHALDIGGEFTLLMETVWSHCRWQLGSFVERVQGNIIFTTNNSMSKPSA